MGDGQAADAASAGPDYSAYIGKAYAPFDVKVAADRVRAFAAAIGETDPLSSDPQAARAAGFRDLVAPPTFSFTLTLDAGQSFNVLADLGIEKTRTVHGEQWFNYHGPICAGDTISGAQRITDIYAKKGGALVFIKIETPLRNQLGEPVATLGSTMVVRNG